MSPCYSSLFENDSTKSGFFSFRNFIFDQNIHSVRIPQLALRLDSSVAEHFHRFRACALYLPDPRPTRFLPPPERGFLRVAAGAVSSGFAAGGVAGNVGADGRGKRNSEEAEQLLRHSLGFQTKNKRTEALSCSS